ncbi:hypothetical protein [Orientia tsutsugamushi]|uniref:hypothetical protein n=1 Tax=Orientia tsutsugamushi TaxID=784 RepID=UPI0007E30653|nr:hypothetical protein [Orientia tsutsugamushi]
MRTDKEHCKNKNEQYNDITTTTGSVKKKIKIAPKEAAVISKISNTLGEGSNIRSLVSLLF